MRTSLGRDMCISEVDPIRHSLFRLPAFMYTLQRSNSRIVIPHTYKPPNNVSYQHPLIYRQVTVLIICLLYFIAVTSIS